MCIWIALSVWIKFEVVYVFFVEQVVIICTLGQPCKIPFCRYYMNNSSGGGLDCVWWKPNGLKRIFLCVLAALLHMFYQEKNITFLFP